VSTFHTSRKRAYRLDALLLFEICVRSELFSLLETVRPPVRAR
jgi:hypothetical protein